MAPADDLLTSPDVGRLLGVSARTVIRRVEAGLLVAAQKLPGPQGAYLFRRADVESYLASRRQERGERDALEGDVDAETDLVAPRVGAA